MLAVLLPSFVRNNVVVGSCSPIVFPISVPLSPLHRLTSEFLVAALFHTSMAKLSSSLSQTLKRYLKKPWELTGPVASPEYKSAIPKATDYRVPCPATFPVKACVPTSDPETVYDIKYFSRDQRRNRPPIHRTILKKADVEKTMKEKTEFSVDEFPRVYLADTIEEDMDTHGGGYQ